MLHSMKEIWRLICINPPKTINFIADQKTLACINKSSCQWFPFHAIMEHTGNIMQDDMHLMSSLLKMFSLFEIRLSCGDKYLGTFCLKCFNCKKETGLNLELILPGFIMKSSLNLC